MAGAEQDGLEGRIRRSIDAYHEAALVYAAVKLGLPEKMGTLSWTVEGLATSSACPRCTLLASCADSRLLAFARRAPMATSR
jgi:hypothetical protein